MISSEERNALSGAGVKRSWRNPETRAKRIAGLIAAWDDPLRRALARKRAETYPPPPHPAKLSPEERRRRKREREKRWLATPEGAALKRARKRRYREKKRKRQHDGGFI
jgi:hypothetical protein